MLTFKAASMRSSEKYIRVKKGLSPPAHRGVPGVLGGVIISGSFPQQITHNISLKLLAIKQRWEIGGKLIQKGKGPSALKAENPFYIWRAWQDSNLRPTDS